MTPQENIFDPHDTDQPEYVPVCDECGHTLNPCLCDWLDDNREE